MGMAKRGRDESPPPSSLDHLSPAVDDRGAASHKYKHTAHTVPPEDLIHCHLPPHKPLAFSTFEEYNTHYSQAHVNRCSQCHKNFPSSHFTSLHIAENHDPLNQAKKARGDKIYECFVEDCDKVCSDPQKRRMHLVDKHHFPKNYDFFIVNDGIDRRKSMLRSNFHRRRRSSLIGPNDAEPVTTSTEKSVGKRQLRKPDAHRSAPNEDPQSDSEESAETNSTEPSNLARKLTPATESEHDDINDITRSMSALRFVPPSVRFGRGRGRGFARR